jgi:hypothetical protein
MHCKAMKRQAIPKVATNPPIARRIKLQPLQLLTTTLPIKSRIPDVVQMMKLMTYRKVRGLSIRKAGQWNMQLKSPRVNTLKTLDESVERSCAECKYSSHKVKANSA